MTASRSRSVLLLNVLVILALLPSSTHLAVASPPAAPSAAEAMPMTGSESALPLRSAAPKADLSSNTLLPSADATLTPTLTVTPTLTPTSTPASTLTVTPTLTVSPVITPTLTPALSPALSLTKSVTPTTAFTGEVVTFTLAVTNTGAAPARGLVLYDTLPKGLEYVPGSAPGAKYDAEERLLTW